MYIYSYSYYYPIDALLGSSDHLCLQVDVFKYERLIGGRHVNNSHWALLVKFMSSCHM